MRILDPRNSEKPPQLFFGTFYYVATRNQNVARSHLADRFIVREINPEGDRLPVCWLRTVKATESDNFLCHILLSLESFSTQLELLSQGSMLQSFIYARLFTK
jgi:hypothetical protein